MNRRWIAGLIAVAALAAPTQAQGLTNVSVSGGELNIALDSNTSDTIQVEYLVGSDEWRVLGSFVTEGSGCPDNEISGSVECPHGNEDIDVDFGGIGGSVSFTAADSFVDFDSDITLGNGTENVTAGDGVDVIHAASTTTVNGDNIDALDGDDQITTGNGSDIVEGGHGGDVIIGNGGNNFLRGGESEGDQDVADGADNITGGSLIDDIDGGAGADTLNGGDDNDEITGGDGDDIIDAGPGNDGVSTFGVDGEDGNDTIDGGTGNDTLQGGDDTDTLNGEDDDDELDGEAGTDTLNGADGADTLLNSDGADAFNGGSSTGDADEVDYSVSSGSSPITADADGQAGDDGRNCPGGSCEQDSVGSDVENLTGDDGADTLVGNGLANTLDGDGGNDTLAGGAGASADSGDHFNDLGGGTDTVTYDPSTGVPRTGNLTVDIDGTADDGTAGELDDIETNIENVTGGSGADGITGSTLNNQLRGGPGTANDTLSGNSGDDTLFGGLGTNAGSDGADVFTGGVQGAAGDTVSYAGRSDVIVASIGGGANDGAGGCPAGAGCEDDNIGTDVDNLIGGGNGDTLTGDGDDNSLDGAAGNDDLFGGAGAADDGSDAFIGGTGADDEVSYASRTDADDDVDVDVDGAADDGLAGELDNVGTTVENLTGGSGDDDLTGDGDANELTGNPGDDDLAGGIGIGADGADVFNGGAHGTAGGQNGDNGDFADYGTRTDDLDIDIGGGANDGGGGCPAGAGCEDDDVQATIERLIAGTGDDVLIGSPQDNTLSGGQGDDLMRGGTGTGPDGADTFTGGNLGETNGDTLSYTGRTDDIVASPQIGGANGGGGCPAGAGCEGDSIDGSTDNITGGSGDDTLSGTSGDNTLNGGAGNDTLAGSVVGTGPDGADTFLAGAPVSSTIDTVTYASRDDDLDADLQGDSDDGAAGELDDISSDIDNITGGEGDDDLHGDGDANALDGGDGDDDLVSGEATGPDGADVYIGGTDNTPGGQNAQNRDRLFLTTRVDDLTVDIGGGANDTDGDDVRGDVETLVGGEGDDVLSGDDDANTVDGRQGDDVVAGGQGTGPDGADILFGGTDGVAGDTVSYATRADGVAVSLTADTGPDGDIVQASIENAIGGTGADTLTGDANPNLLEGGLGSDDFFALAGTDTVRAADGQQDDVDCGDDPDTAIVDPATLDNVTACETLDRLPETTITDHPRRRTRSRRATFAFEADEPATFECRLDGGDFEACSSPVELTQLSRQRHTFRVRATDLNGNPELKPAKFVWRIRD